MFIKSIFCVARKDDFLEIRIFGIRLYIYSKYYALENKLKMLADSVTSVDSRVTDVHNEINNRVTDVHNAVISVDSRVTELDHVNKLFAKFTYDNNLVNNIKKYDLKKPSNTKLQNILSINTVAKRGGAAKIAYTVANEVGKREFNSIMATGGIHEMFNDNEEYVRFLSLSSNEYEAVQYLNNRTGYLDFFYYNSLRLKDKEEFKNADLVHLHNLHGGYFSYFALPELTALKPTIWTLHDEQSFTGHCGFSLDCHKWENEECLNCPYVSLYQGLPFDTANFIYKNKKHIYKNMASDLILVAPSNWLIDRLQKSILSDYDIRLINNGIDESVYISYEKEYVRNELKLPQNKKILMFSCDGGDTGPWKGGEYIKAVYEKFSSNKDLFFIVIGGGTESEILNGNYLKVPYIYDESLLAKYYSASDLFIYPSKADNHPLTVIEALSCGLPVITFNTGGIPEIVEHMKTGYVARHCDIDDFIKGINIFLSDNDLVKSASVLGRKRVEGKFTNKLMIDRYIKLYNEVYEKRLKLK